MDYVMLLRWKQGLTRDERDGALMNRAGWNYPSGVKVIAEYWPAAEDPAVVSNFPDGRLWRTNGDRVHMGRPLRCHGHSGDQC